jgi:hypothetical protein
MLVAGPATHFLWSENAVNVALTGVAWIVADSLAKTAGSAISGLTGSITRQRGQF